MSLDFDYSKVKEFEGQFLTGKELFGPAFEGDPEARWIGPKMNAVIWATIIVDMNGPTEENYKEFYARYCAAQGAMGHEPYLKIDDVKNMIGLTTNVPTIKSRKQWLREKLNRIMDNCINDLNYHERVAAKNALDEERNDTNPEVEPDHGTIVIDL